MQIEEKYPEMNKLIQTGKERGYILYEELFEKLPEEVTGIAEELDEIYLRLNELDIDVMDGESGDGEGDFRPGEHSEQAEADKAETAKPVVRPPKGSSKRPTTRSACTCARWARSSFSTAKARSRSLSGSRPARPRVFIALSKEMRILELFLRTNEQARRERRGVRELLQTDDIGPRRKGRGPGRRGAASVSPRSESWTRSPRSSNGGFGAARRPANGTRSCRTRSTPTPLTSRSWCGERISRPPPGTAC